ncbi:sigma-70 family RNA polymerase sigma factor, partial [Streptococcus sp. X16XC17]|uniref:sigma-70 family RNA polymerase sigma factor n=1 Tax=Streptococcus sp. X16XC17 TaxID=2316646 RepID=UPI00103ACDDF
MEPFEALYSRVKGIVHKTRKEYYIKRWEKEDWDQEGMLVLYELLEDHPDLALDQGRLYIYYKVKFRNYLKDLIRKQESQKRKFDRMVPENIDELAHQIKSPGLLNDDFACLRARLRSYRSQLSAREASYYPQLISGERFSGRKK